jgi:hypothetical protein
MKKSIFILAIALIAGAISSYAQGGGFQMPTPEERVKRVNFKMDSAFKLEPAKMKEVEALYLDFYKTGDKVREEVRAANQGGDFQEIRNQVMEKMKPYQEALDAKVKPILGDQNFAIWKEKIEPTLRGRGGPPRQ